MYVYPVVVGSEAGEPCRMLLCKLIGTQRADEIIACGLREVVDVRGRWVFRVRDNGQWALALCARNTASEYRQAARVAGKSARVITGDDFLREWGFIEEAHEEFQLYCYGTTRLAGQRLVPVNAQGGRMSCGKIGVGVAVRPSGWYHLRPQYAPNNNLPTRVAREISHRLAKMGEAGDTWLYLAHDSQTRRAQVWRLTNAALVRHASLNSRLVLRME